MPYLKNSAKIQNALSNALQSTEVVKALRKQVSFAAETLKEAVLSREEYVWSTLGKDIAEFDALEATVEKAKRDFETRAPRPSRSIEIGDTVIAFGTLALFGLAIMGGIQIYRTSWEIVTSNFWGTWPKFVLFGGLNALAIGNLLKIVGQRRFEVHRRDYERVGEEEFHPIQHAAELKALQVALDQKVEATVRGELRLLLHAWSSPRYASSLTVTHAPGLAEVFYPAYEINTAAKDRLLGLLRRMPGGSIGIAGPRGAGKSTLISSLCGGQRKLGTREVFAVFTTAPVKYDSREFILHLFSTLCRAVLKLGPGEDLPPEDPANYKRSWLVRVQGAARRALLPITFVASALIAAGFAFAFISASLPPVIPPAPAAAAATAASGSLAAFKRPSPVEIVRAMVPSASVFAVSGITVLVLLVGVLVAPEGLQHGPGSLISGRLRRDRHGVELQHLSPLSKLATDRLREINFQRSFTSGWSGTLKLPFGAEGGLNQAQTFADKQRSVPELVAEFRDFVKLLAAEHAVVIGIDELDKIDNDEAAQQFLNEIKAIFSLDRCFYLVSVSENAINSFERRGLPFRDAFDSAFDTILYVDYLDLDQAKGLISRRVIGLEVPFMDLCYCLSGGLPRDLIRVCREMLEISSTEPAVSDLESVCARLVLADVRAKLRSLAATINRIQLEPESGELLAAVETVSRSTKTRLDFLHASMARPRPFQRNNAGESPAYLARREQLHAVAWEFFAYMYFSNTILQVFSSELTEQSLKTAESNGLIATLACVRQNFSINSQLAMAQLDTVRKGLALTTIN